VPLGLGETEARKLLCESVPLPTMP
jgi:hypothetical protein